MSARAASRVPVPSRTRLDATMAFDAPVSQVRQVSPARAEALRKRGVQTVRDLVCHFPRRYIDLSSVLPAAHARIGDACTVRGTVHEVRLKRPRPRMSLVEVSVVDDSGVLMITCFGQPWLADQLSAGMRVAVAGTVEFSYGFKRMTNPFIEVIDDEADALGGMIVPVHPATERITTAWMRRLVRNALDHVEGCLDPLPLSLRLRHGLMSRGAALRAIHFPSSMTEAARARRRLAYEELLLLQLELMTRDEGRLVDAACAHAVDGARARSFVDALPFALTDEQRAACAQIDESMASPRPAHHMLLGDVGTGKTVVAGRSLASVADTGTQGALMAPTELLARQHAASLGPLFDQAGVIWGVLTGSTPADERALLLERVAAGVVDVLIGTHALLEPDVRFRSLTLAVIDEQQRFGVHQRAALVQKGACPDVLLLTATPIPRTLALALYGNMTLSYLRARPAGLQRRETRVLTRQTRGVAYDAARAALARGERVYVVCPLVGAAAAEKRAERAGKGPRQGDAPDEEERAFPEVAIDSEDDLREVEVASAKREAAFLQQKVFCDHAVELVHGRMAAAAKQEAMERFRTGRTQVLVATTVIEVGVDVPEATVMIVEDADRFGLAQLHQLRGRVGRGGRESWAFLVSSSRSEAALARLAAMEGSDDGFELAAFDLSLRREGDILGNRQHGASVLRLVNVVRDAALIEAAHADARALVDADPQLQGPEARVLAREMRLAFAAAEREGEGR
ncbi:ATP-dependent DNA helicase RecG [Eggerthellaceae bacterium zg-1084]|uniref:ATP-dependent DNA helicase RecG n=1 Tax=Berryella wangjianweii TaxID=2734634 RepID=UPI0015539389|nr:ATP-dependent DNA helicase RecG [Berryella wangjianweii]NPD31240.1 ATP-dependent DNA helicase RecG [Berryella wangjianweii]